MNIEKILTGKTAEAFEKLYGQQIDSKVISFQKTRPEFEGDVTLVVFPLIKLSKKSPAETAQEIGSYLKENVKEVAGFNVVKGFLNLVIHNSFWLGFFNSVVDKTGYGTAKEATGKTIMVEYSSPNTNKPLHLGHIRNNLLGYSVAEILKANGHRVIKTNLVNDRGIHICKSMLAWQKFGNGETPESSGIKGDHLAGKYYVEFDRHYKKEIEELVSCGASREEAEKQAPLMLEAQKLLRKWEQNDPETIRLWKVMNGWVYKGFEETYKMLGVDFDEIYYESNTYLLGKEIVEEGLKKGVFLKKDDGSVWIDLTPDGLDQKLLLRSDGTSVYMTQDLGTAKQRHDKYKMDALVYVVGNEQDYHFKVLKLILQKLGYSWSNGLYHLSYGMVELPHGKMKSREGTVVDADDLIQEMISAAKEKSAERGKIENLNGQELEHLNKIIGLAALKYFILKVDPKKKMVFNPEESIDLNGNTGPFIQYTHARICSVLRKANAYHHATPGAPRPASPAKELPQPVPDNMDLQDKEKALLKLLYGFPEVIKESGENYSPAPLANYTYELAKEYNQFYAECPILKEEDERRKAFRLALSEKTAEVIKNATRLLGMEVPERM